jgi:hypothetical protein
MAAQPVRSMFWPAGSLIACITPNRLLVTAGSSRVLVGHTGGGGIVTKRLADFLGPFLYRDALVIQGRADEE